MTATMTLQDLKHARLLPGPALRNLVRIEGTLTTSTELHIGSGEARGSTEEDLPRKTILREDLGAPDDHVRPWIPGSSLRGVLRAWTLAVLAPFGPEVAPLPGPAADGDDIDPPTPDEISDDRVWQGDERRALRTRDEIDLVGGLYGSTRWRGKVEVRSAALEKGKTVRVGVINRVALDPNLGSAEEGKLFAVEYVPRDTTFHVEIIVRNVLSWELGLVLLALESFNHPHFATRLGALGTHDWGRMKWRLEQLSRLGRVTEDGPAGSPLTDWIAALNEERTAVRIPKAEADTLVASTRASLSRVLSGIPPWTGG